MGRHSLTLIEYGTVELHPLLIKNSWMLSGKEVCVALNIPLSKIMELLENLIEDKHYSYESIEYSDGKFTSSILFFSKIGIIRLAYILKNSDALKFLEFIEDIEFKNKGTQERHSFYDEIEELLKDRLERLKTDPNTSLEEINKFILTFDNLIKKQKYINTPNKPNTKNMGDILETVINLAQSYSHSKP